MIYNEERKRMTKFERNEDGKFVCPACEREYEKYNSLYRHYNQKHGNSNGEEKVDRAEKSTTTKYGNSDNIDEVNRAVKSVTTKIKKIPETVTKEITGSNSGNDLADDENQSSEIEDNTSLSRVSKKKIKRVRLKPVEPPVKKPQKAKENENEEETANENWLIHGILHGFSKNEQKVSEKLKVSEEEPERKYLLIEGLI
jgi:hypothetical protein